MEIAADCRNLFTPLTELASAPVRQALHVEAINWDNDGVLTNDAFQKDGLRIRLDAPPDPASVSNDSILVTLDYPFAQNDQVSPNVRQRLVLLGVAGIDPNDPQMITWRFQEQAEVNTDTTAGTVGAIGPNSDVFKLRPRDTVARASRTAAFRINVTLRGRFLWQDAADGAASGAAFGRLYLDGQAFGRPVALPGTAQVRTDLLLPSGDGARASDFESWFFLGTGGTRADTLKVKSVVFRSVIAGTPARTVLTVDSLPLDPAKTPQFKAGEKVNRIRVFFTRPVQPEGEFPIGEPQNVLVERVFDGGDTGRCFGPVIVKGDMLEFEAMDPRLLDDPGDYRLTVFAEEGDFGPGIRAQDDSSLLDGDYDDNPGAHFVLPFRALG